MCAPHRHTLVRPKIADAKGALQINDATSRVAGPLPSQLGRPSGNVTRQCCVSRGATAGDRVSLSDFSVTCVDLRDGQAASLRKTLGKCSSCSRTAVLITA